MIDVVKLKTLGKGAFAFQTDVKVLLGSRCGLKRNKDNIHGTNREELNFF